ncbi:MAG: MFS transporter, partial [Anaerolineales bacterium]
MDLTLPIEPVGAKPEADARNSVLAQVGAMTYARLVMNVSHRMPYPFLPEFSRGLGVPLDAIVLVLSGRSAISIAAPLLGSLSDRFGRRPIMFLSLAIFAGAMAMVALWPSWPIFVAALLLETVAKLLFDAASYAYIGDHIPYARRGMVSGFFEISWSAAFLIGMPAVGWLMARRAVAAWQAPFPMLVLLGLAALVAMRLAMPRGRPAAGPGAISLATGWRSVLKDRSALAAIGVGLLISAASENLNVVLGVWLESNFGLSLAALGLSTAVIGVAELVGEGGVIGIVDRVGKKRSITAGALASAAAYFSLPLIGGGLAGGLAGLFLTFVAFEFTIVATLPPA